MSFNSYYSKNIFQVVILSVVVHLSISSSRLVIELDGIPLLVAGPGYCFKTVVHGCSSAWHWHPSSQQAFPERKLLTRLEIETHSESNNIL